MEILHLGEYPEPFWRAGGARPPDAVNGGCPMLPPSLPLVSRQPGSGMLLGCRVTVHYNELHELATERPPE